MTTPIREQLLAAITARVQGEYGIPAPEDERDLPVTIVQDESDEALENRYGLTRLAMPVAIGRAEVVESGATRDELRAQANDMLAAIIVAMHTDDSFDGLAEGVEYLGGGIQTDARFVFCEASFRIRYHHARGNPYSLEPDDGPPGP